MTTRLSINELRSARVRRERYVGDWLPEPIVTDNRDDPAQHAETADSVSLAMLVLLERLSPEQRAVLLLHDVFDYGYPAIATIVGKREENVRQLAYSGAAATRIARANATAVCSRSAGVCTAEQKALVLRMSTPSARMAFASLECASGIGEKDVEDAGEPPDGPRDAGLSECSGPFGSEGDGVVLCCALRDSVGHQAERRDPGNGTEGIGVEGAGVGDLRRKQFKEFGAPRNGA